MSGSGHSFTDCALTDEVMIRLDRLTKPLDFDPESGLFKVEAGVVLRDLNLMLDERGVAFENLGDIDRQTVAGSISTGTHGTGERFQNLSAQIAAMELVTADGSVVTVDDSDPDLLRAARVAIGALGVIYSVTLRTVPAYTINRVDSPKPLAETLERLDELNAGTDHFEFYVFPHTEMALCRESRRTDEPPAPRNRAAGLRAGGGARELGRAAVRAGDPPVPVARAAARADRLARRSAARPRSTRATRSSPPSATSGSPRWSTRCRASTAGR